MRPLTFITFVGFVLMIAATYCLQQLENYLTQYPGNDYIKTMVHNMRCGICIEK